MEDVPWDTDEGDYPNSCQGGSAGVLMTLPAGWYIARDDAQARDVIKRSWFATTCMVTYGGRGYFTRAHTDLYAAGSDCGHSQLFSSGGDGSFGEYAVNYCNRRILIAKAMHVQSCWMYPS